MAQRWGLQPRAVGMGPGVSQGCGREEKGAPGKCRSPHTARPWQTVQTLSHQPWKDLRLARFCSQLSGTLTYRGPSLEPASFLAGTLSECWAPLGRSSPASSCPCAQRASDPTWRDWSLHRGERRARPWMVDTLPGLRATHLENRQSPNSRLNSAL